MQSILFNIFKYQLDMSLRSLSPEYSCEFASIPSVPTRTDSQTYAHMTYAMTDDERPILYGDELNMRWRTYLI